MDAKERLLRELRSDKRSTRQIAQDYPNITHGDISRLKKHGIFPKSPEKLLSLGIKPTKEVETCDCGEVHTRKTCPKLSAVQRRPRLIAQVDADIKDEFKEEAERLGLTEAELLRRLVRNYMEVHDDEEG